MSGDTTRARIETQRFHEEQALAEMSLENERFISLVRLGAQLSRVVLFPAGMMIAAGSWDAPPLPGLARGLWIGAYTIFCITTVYVLHWHVKKANAKQAWSRPFVPIAVDHAFSIAMGLTTPPAEMAFQHEISIAGLALLLGFSALRPNRTHVIVGTLAAMVAYAVIAIDLYFWNGRPVSPVVVIFVEGTFAAFGWLVVRSSRNITSMWLNLRRRENLSRFLPRHVVQTLMISGASIEPIKREVTVLFSDIRDFTAISETMDPQALLKMLDEYFAHMSQVVQAHEGTVGKFIGDGMLAYWNVPMADSSHQAKAVRAALDMRKALAELNVVRERSGLPRLRIGVGIHTGLAAAGEMGGASETLREYTVIGDAVNVASRVEGLTKEHGCDVLVSEATWQGLNGAFVGVSRGESQVKGREKAVLVWEVQRHVSEQPG